MTFDLSGYIGINEIDTGGKKRKRKITVEAALEILKAEAQNTNVRINYNKNLVKIYADQIEEALKVEDKKTSPPVGE